MNAIVYVVRRIFNRIKDEVELADQLYHEVLDHATDLDDLIEASLESLSDRQVTAQQQIDALVHEITMKRLAIADGAHKAEHVQKIRQFVRSAVGEVKDAVDEVVEAAQEALDDVRS